MGAGPSSASDGRAAGKSAAEWVALLQASNYVEFVACASKGSKILKAVLNGSNGDTGVHILAGKGCVEGLQAALDAYVARQEAKSGRALGAVERGKKAAKLLNIINYKGRTPLMAAAKAGHTECVVWLLRNNAEAAARDKAGASTAAHYAAASGHEAVLQVLADWSRGHTQGHPARSLVDMPNANGFTPLHYAAWNKRYKAVALLCELGADLYTASNWLATVDMMQCSAGSTPLHLAAMSGSTRTVKAIMAGYAERLGLAQNNPNSNPVTDPRLVQDLQGNLAYAVALQRGHMRLLQLLHPLTTLDDVFATDHPDERAVGVPHLHELAALVAQQVLLSQLDAVEQSLVGSVPAPDLAPAAPTPTHTPGVTPRAAAAAVVTAAAGTPPCGSTSGVPAAGAAPAAAATSGSQGTHTPPRGSASGTSGNTEPSRDVHATLEPIASSPGTPLAPAAPLVASALPSPFSAAALQWAAPSASPPPAAGEALQQHPPHHQTSFLPNASSPELSLMPGASSTSTSLLPEGRKLQHQETGGSSGPDSAGAGTERKLRPWDEDETSGDKSWLQRRGAWRAHLQAARRPGAGGGAAAAGGSGVAHLSRSGSQQSGQSSGDASTDWMRRRSAWRDSLLRHRQQLLATAQVVPRVRRSSSQPELAQGQLPTGAANANAHPAMHTLRLLGLGTILDTGNRAGGGAVMHKELENQVDTAIHMLRVHRLTRGVVEEYNGGPSAPAADVFGGGAAATNTAVFTPPTGTSPRQGAPARGPGTPPPDPAPSLTRVYTQGFLLQELRTLRSTNLATHLKGAPSQELAGFHTTGGAIPSAGAPRGASGEFAALHTSAVDDRGQRMSADGRGQRALVELSGGSPPPYERQPSLRVVAGSVGAGAGAGAGSRQGVHAPSTSSALSPKGSLRLSADMARGSLGALGVVSPHISGEGAPLLASGGGIGRLSRAPTMRSGRIAPSEGWEETCGVCLDTGQFCALQRCQHKLCITCMRELIKLHATKPALCPFCRSLIMGVQQPKPK